MDASSITKIIHSKLRSKLENSPSLESKRAVVKASGVLFLTGYRPLIETYALSNLGVVSDITQAEHCKLLDVLVKANDEFLNYLDSEETAKKFGLSDEQQSIIVEEARKGSILSLVKSNEHLYKAYTEWKRLQEKQ